MTNVSNVILCHILCLKASPISWSMSINLSRKSLTEATLRRMMGWRGSIHCSFPWPSWRPRFPTLCSAWHPSRHNFRLWLPCERLRLSESDIKRALRLSLLLGLFSGPRLTRVQQDVTSRPTFDGHGRCERSRRAPQWGPTAAAFQHREQPPSKPAEQTPPTH